MKNVFPGKHRFYILFPITIVKFSVSIIHFEINEINVSSKINVVSYRMSFKNL